MTEHNNQTLREPSRSIWYVLATIDGEPRTQLDVTSITVRNRHYWNGLMKSRVATYGGMIQSRLEHDINFPDLSSADHTRIRQVLDARGFRGVDIPHVNSTIDFSHMAFSQFTSFVGFIFGGETQFNNTKFSNDVLLFNEAVFAGNVTFDEAEFCHDTVFMDAEFAGGASLCKTNFLKQAFISSAKFTGPTNFQDAVFLGDALFNSTEFRGETRFVHTLFTQKADFQSAEFTRPTHFQRAKFESSIPSFFDATLYEYTDWHRSQWPDVPNDADQAREQVQYYQRLGLLMSQLQKPNDQHFFFRKEMKAQRRAEGWNIPHLMNWLYEIFCDYGYGLGRISAIWASHIGAGALAMWFFKTFNTERSEFSWRIALEILYDIPPALVISFSNAHALLGLSRSFLDDTYMAWKCVPLFNTVGGVQTVVGVILLFFLLLTVRNRFRMR